MDKSKKKFLIAVIFFLILLAYFVYDFSRRTKFRGSYMPVANKEILLT